MNQQTVQSIVSICSQFENLNYEEIISRTYPDRTDLENIQLSQISLAEFIFLVKKTVAHFASAVNNRETAMILPLLYTHGQFGNAQVDSQLQNLYTYTIQANLPSAEQFLLWLVGYQVEYGIYSNENWKKNDTFGDSLNALVEKLKLTQQSIINQRKEIESLYKSLDTSNKEIQNLITQKREELNQITTNLATSNSQVSQIADLLNKATEQNSRLNTILEQQEQNKLQSDKKLKDLQDLYLETNDKLDENVKTVVSQIETFSQQVTTNQVHLEFIEGKKGFFEERINYLENLIGREVGASLFETFKQRKTELNSPLVMWRWAVGILGSLTFVVILAIFTNFFGVFGPYETALRWENVLVNALKSLPFFFLLYYAIAQYNKERNFQEEYAFKSAAALTIKAYADILKDDKNKDELILKAVYSIYRSPISNKPKNMREVNSAFDMVGDIVEKGTTLIQKKNG
jgi:hypothetical protein